MIQTPCYTSVCFRRVINAVAILFAATLSLPATAQPPGNAADFEQLIEYAQCIRANGYPDFPDPAPGQGVRIRLEPGTIDKFQAAQAACKDKMPSSMQAAQQPPTPERMEALLGFAACMRDNGFPQFPDPGADGAFQINGGFDQSDPRTGQARDTCMKSNPPGGLMIRSVQRTPQ
jgi:hypothetical protein